MSGLALRLAESGLLPDALLRAGIRSLLRKRLLRNSIDATQHGMSKRI